MSITVTDENYAYAMCDMAMQQEFASGADNTWHHHRRVMALDEQPAPMMNRDTLYSFAIVDGRGDIRVVLPETDGRYQTLHVVNHDHVTFGVFYGAGEYVLPAEGTTDFLYLNVRTRINPNDPDDQRRVNAYQDQLVLEHLDGYQPSSFEVANWDMDSFMPIHRKYVEIANERGIQGSMGTVDHPVPTAENNRGVSIGTGLLPDRDAVYLTGRYTVDRSRDYVATYQVPALRDEQLGFCSITMYGDDQHLKTDEGSILTDTDIVLNDDGETFDVRYVSAERYNGGPNQLLVPTDEFWINFRIYMPTDAVLAGADLPQPHPAG